MTVTGRMGGIRPVATPAVSEDGCWLDWYIADTSAKMALLAHITRRFDMSMIPREVSAADLVKARNDRQVEADLWRAAHPGPLDDDLAYAIGEWVEHGGIRPFGEPDARLTGGHVYPPITPTPVPPYRRMA